MYGSDAGQPMPSLYTKGLSPLCDSKQKECSVYYSLSTERYGECRQQTTWSSDSTDHVALLVFGPEHLGHILEAVAVRRLHTSGRERHGDDTLSDVCQVQVKLLIHKPITTSDRGGSSHTVYVHV